MKTAKQLKREHIRSVRWAVIRFYMHAGLTLLCGGVLVWILLQDGPGQPLVWVRYLSVILLSASVAINGLSVGFSLNKFKSLKRTEHVYDD